jgi:hypothetical protein
MLTAGMGTIVAEDEGGKKKGNPGTRNSILIPNVS